MSSHKSANLTISNRGDNMTGTGTQADPYICETWEELVSVSTAKTIYIEMAENLIFDFNEIQPRGFDSRVNLSGQIDFNGCIFRNFYSTAVQAVYVISGSSWENLTFDNFLHEVSSSSSSQNVGFLCTDSGSSALQISNCKFYGKVNYGIYSTKNAIVFYSWSYNILQFEQCGFNVECVCTSGIFSFFRMDFVKDCNVKLKVVSATANIVQSHGSSNVQKVYNSLITGKITVTDTSSNILCGAALSGYNVFKIETNAPLNYAGNGISVFDSDLSPDTTGGENFAGCTTTQLKNAEYLYSVGFPCYW